jgi:hypothetical protein
MVVFSAWAIWCASISNRLLLIEPLRDLGGFLTFTLLGVWMLLPKDRWIALLERAGFINLKYKYHDYLGVFLVEKPE